MFRTVHFYIYHISCQEREEDKQHLLETLCCSSILILACYYPYAVKRSKCNNLISLHNPTKKAWRKSLRHAPIKENLIVKIEISYSSLVLCILRIKVGPAAHPVGAAIEGSDVGYGVETCPAGETCGTEQWASCDRSIAICTNQ